MRTYENHLIRKYPKPPKVSNYSNHIYVNIAKNISISNQQKGLRTEAVTWRYSVKKVFLEISQNSHENNCSRVSFLIQLQAPATLLKERLWCRCFSVNFAKFLRTPFFTEHLRWLILQE